MLLPATTAMLVLLGFLAVGCGDDKEGSETPTPAAITPSPAPEPTPSPGPTPAMVAGLVVQTWTVKEPASLTQDTVVYVEKGCIQCDGPTEAIERVANIGNPGETTLSVETLFTAPGGAPRYIQSFVFGMNGSDAIFASVCSRGYCGGVGQISADAQSTLYRSADGGVSWEALWTRDGSWGVLSATGEGVVLAHDVAPAPGELPEFVDLNGNSIAITPPQPGATPIWTRGFGYFIWRLADRATFVNSRGDVLFAPPSGLQASGNGISLSGAYDNRNPDGFVINWRDGSVLYQGLVRGGRLEAVYRSQSADLPPYVGAWIDATHAVGTAWLRSSDVPGRPALPAEGGLNLPVLIDFEHAELTPLLLYGPLSSDAYRGRNFILGWQQATFWRVATAGSCLYLRERPSTSAPSVACVADDVLLAGAGKGTITDASGTIWGLMEGPGFISGWVALQYVVRR